MRAEIGGQVVKTSPNGSETDVLLNGNLVERTYSNTVAREVANYIAIALGAAYAAGRADMEREIGERVTKGAL